LERRATGSRARPSFLELLDHRLVDHVFATAEGAQWMALARQPKTVKLEKRRGRGSPIPGNQSAGNLWELTMKYVFAIACAAAILAVAGAGRTEPYKDYTPQKGVWQVQEVHVDPNHIDDYLTGIKTSLIPTQEVAKKHGLIDNSMVLVRMDSNGGGANVMFVTHYPSLAALEPDKARDQAMEQESLAILSKDKGAALVAGFEKYRTFVGDGFWQVMDMGQ
jgi:hypothetical protein